MEVAYDKEVLERAIEIAKRDFGHEVSMEEMEEVYKIVAKFIKREINNNEKYYGVYLRKLGTAYLTIVDANKKKFMNYNTKDKFDFWQKKVDEMEEHYQNNDSRKNRKAFYRSYHSETPLWKMARRKGFTIEDMEEIQNKIK